MTTIFNYLKDYMRYRLSADLLNEKIDLPELNLDSQQSTLAQFIKSKHLNNTEIIILLLALVPNVNPGFLNNIITEFLPKGGDLPEFGGVKGKNHRGILPTGETVQFITAGYDFKKREQVAHLLLGNSVLFKNGIINLESPLLGEPLLSGRLIIDQEYAELLLYNQVSPPVMSTSFPAKRIDTQLTWEDLVLPKKTWNEIEDIENWLTYNSILVEDWKMKNIKPGFQVLFYGPSGTGKTLTASLLGKYTKREVYRIDLSVVVSKYIGETEKNLSRLFKKAENKNWILFFDEADAIFGKRTQVQDAHDKYANQEVSYLLQRIEAHPGLVILATNYKSNIDEAFTRRFHSMIEFKLPSFKERLEIWNKNLPSKLPLKDTSFLDDIAKKYALTGAHIVNIVQFACLKSISLSLKHLPKEILVEGIEREYIKEGKAIN